MPYCIDEFIVFRSTVFVRGWASQQPALRVKGTVIAAFVERESREDLIDAFGGEAAQWGFHLRAFFPGAMDLSDMDMVFGPDVVDIRQFIPVSDKACEEIFDHFITSQDNEGYRVLEIGARARSGISRRSLFKKSSYTGFDVLAGPNVDVVGDAHYLSDHVPHAHFDAVFSISTFEHLMMPWKVAAELNIILKPGGLVYTHTHQTWPVHDAPWDFFRFSRDAWKAIFNPATGFEIISAEYGERAVSTPAFQIPGNEATKIDRESGYLKSVCIARKTGAPAYAYALPRETFAQCLKSTPYPA